MTNELINSDKLIGWLRQQPADEPYIWSDPVFCLMGRYLADHDSSWGTVQYSDMPDYERIAGEKPWTFGAALERAEMLKALPPPSIQIEDKTSEPVTVEAV